MISKPNPWLLIPLILITLSFSGCATFNPSVYVRDLLASHQPVTSQSHAGLEVSVEEFVSPDKSRKAFDADLAPHGVLALLLRLNNKSASNYLVDEKNAKAYLNGQILPRLQGIDAARQAATSDAVGKAAAWTAATGPFAVLFWPVTISASASHTKEINRQVENHFRNFELGKNIVRPDQTAGGFLFFRIPNGVQRLEKLILEVAAAEESTAASLNFRLQFPMLELSSPASSPVSSDGNSVKQGENQ